MLSGGNMAVRTVLCRMILAKVELCGAQWRKHGGSDGALQNDFGQGGAL